MHFSTIIPILFLLTLLGVSTSTPLSGNSNSTLPAKTKGHSLLPQVKTTSSNTNSTHVRVTRQKPQQEHQGSIPTPSKPVSPSQVIRGGNAPSSSSVKGGSPSLLPPHKRSTPDHDEDELTEIQQDTHQQHHQHEDSSDDSVPSTHPLFSNPPTSSLAQSLRPKLKGPISTPTKNTSADNNGTSITKKRKQSQDEAQDEEEEEKVPVHKSVEVSSSSSLRKNNAGNTTRKGTSSAQVEREI